MRRWAVLAWIAAAGIAQAGAADLADAVEQGNALLRAGQSEAALEAFVRLQAENPDSAEVLLGLGSALYQEGLRAAESGGPEEALERFREAEASFSKAQALGDEAVDRLAGYNRANATAQIAKQLPAMGEREAAVDALRGAMERYEGFLRTHPGHPQAQQNLDHVRYTLKLLLQDPPPQESEPEPQDNSENPEEQEQDQQQQPSSGEEEEEQDQSSQSESESSDESRSDPSQPQPSEGSLDRPPSQDPSDEAEREDPDRRNIEALLESLEDQDRQEQQQLRQSPRENRLREDWW